MYTTRDLASITSRVKAESPIGIDANEHFRNITFYKTYHLPLVNILFKLCKGIPISPRQNSYVTETIYNITEEYGVITIYVR